MDDAKSPTPAQSPDETRQAKKGIPFKDITVEPGDTFWPRMER